MRKSILLFAIFLFSTMSVFAQRKAAGTGMIIGNVTDSVSKLPIEYVSIGVYPVDKDSLVSGIVTDSTGKFLLQKIPNGKFVVKFSFIGYKPFASKEITIDAKQQFVMLEPVVLSPTSSTLGAVSVEGQRKPFEQTFNKKIFLMDDKRTAGAQTALDLLKTLPSVTIDEEGNVKFRGQSPTILVDNQPYHLLYPKLEMIPAANCDKVEFIEPSARFASSVGTINIKLKKPKEKGLSGAIYANAGTWDFKKASNYYSGMNINYKYKKLILFANGYYGGNVFENKNSNSSSFMYNDSTFISGFEGRLIGNSIWGS
ncbi:MAG: carboxypeptidase regulatory-like domain-containing protein, partial [Bacteroidota bacterium]